MNIHNLSGSWCHWSQQHTGLGRLQCPWHKDRSCHIDNSSHNRCQRTHRHTLQCTRKHHHKQT